MNSKAPQNLNICMVSDFFYPNVGGIESHIYQLSFCLRQLGHNVVIVTHAYGSRIGVRYITGGIKVYYLPIPAFHDQCILPTMLVTLPFLRVIFLRNKINIVHGHSAFSPLAHEALFHAKLMGIHTVFTDHSLFGFADVSSILTNQLLCMSLATCDHVVCVSHMSKENTVLRARFPDPWSVSVIPNAVDATKFLPKVERSRKREDVLNIVTISRLVYRRGIDLLADIIPSICEKFPQVRFLICGDGPKRITLEEMREKYLLQERVLLLGRIEHDQVPTFLLQGSIYINTSLTEAFCISIIEAAAVGLLVVSTKVGGIPEVLPSDMMRLAEADARSLQLCLETAIHDVLKEEGEEGKSLLSPGTSHHRVSVMYSWMNVAERTELVYRRAMQRPIPTVRDLVASGYRHCGFFSRVLMVVLILLDFIGIVICEWFLPAESLRCQSETGTGLKRSSEKDDVSRRKNSYRREPIHK